MSMQTEVDVFLSYMGSGAISTLTLLLNVAS